MHERYVYMKVQKGLDLDLVLEMSGLTWFLLIEDTSHECFGKSGTLASVCHPT